VKTQVSLIGAVVFTIALSAGGGAAAPQTTGQPAKPAVQNQNPPQSGRSQSGPDRVRRGAWWKDAEVMKEVGITAEQSKKIDDLFHKRLPDAMARETELKKQDTILQRLLTERTVGADVIGVQVDRVEALRTTQYKTRTMMVYDMYLVLSAEQYKKLVAYWERQRGRGDSRSR
jgi:Spy/CpxP family protein refolding chaperone